MSRRGLISRVIIALGLLGALAPTAASASPPQIGTAWAEGVSTTTAELHAELDAGGSATTFRFEYVAEKAYLANLAGGADGFLGAVRTPVPDGFAGKGGKVSVSRQAVGLAAETSYFYRVVATNAEGTAEGLARRLTTRGGGGPLVLLDGRGWEMVSPIDKNGGAIQGPGEIAGGGVLQVAADGESITYGSTSSFGSDAQGAPVASQYLSSRGGAGWSTVNTMAPTTAGAYGESPDGVPFQLFSSDLARAVLFDGLSCAGGKCLRGYSLWPGVLSAVSPAEPDLRLAGAAPDLRYLVLSTCAALTAEAAEEPGAEEGCDPADANLYEWGEGGLSLVNDSGGEIFPVPFGRLAAQAGAISEDGRRVYWQQSSEGTLWLHEEGGSQTAVPGTAGTGAVFQTASADGEIAYFTAAGTLYRFDAVSGSSNAIAAGVTGVLGVSADGSVVYYQSSAGLHRWTNGVVAMVAPGAEAAAPSDYPPASGSARVSADGAELLFLSAAELTPYDNTDAATGSPDTEVYLADAASGGLTCVSCNPTGERPTAPASISGAIANGSSAEATQIYKPRVLTDEGGRVFFETSDSLVLQDTNHAPDVFEWEAGGTGSCSVPGGCVELISGGRGAGGARFVDASADGHDVFFLTDASLVGADPGSVDVYDAREGGGFPEPDEPILCEEDACQPLPSPPEDPLPGSLRPSAGNPPARVPNTSRCPRGTVRRGRHCVRKGHRRRGTGHHRRHRGGHR